MPLDKLTLHALLAVLNNNRVSLDTAIAEKTKAIEQLSFDLTSTRGARQYHELLMQQVNNMLAEIERTTPPAA